MQTLNLNELGVNSRILNAENLDWTKKNKNPTPHTHKNKGTPKVTA